MIFVLNQDLIRDGSISSALGLSLCFAADKRGHVLLTDPLWDASDLSQPINAWIATLSPELAQAVNNILEASLNELLTMRFSTRRVYVDSSSPSQWHQSKVSPLDCLRLMWTPLWLVLENGRTDLQFLRRILEKRDSQALDERLHSGRIEVPLGGGTGELRRFLEDLATLPTNGTYNSKHTTGWIRRLRSWVMFDKDANPIDQTLASDESEALRNLCNEMTVPQLFPGHQLGRRTIENYLPYEALSAWAENGDSNKRKERRQKVAAFKSSIFGDLRRCCFSMKEGLLKDSPKDVREGCKRDSTRILADIEVAPTFKGLDHQVRQHLKNGFGKDIAEQYGNTAIADAWFQRVFANDADANAWRTQIVESLWEVL